MPAASKPENAAKLFLEALGSVIDCVTAQHLEVSSYVYTPNEPHTATFPDPVSLRSPHGGPTGLLLAVTHVFANIEAERELFRRQWRITTRMYDYSLLDHDQTELLVYHWQPDADPAHPHLHVSAALRARTSAVGGRTIDLDSLHLATGRVSLEAMIRMLITEFEVAPQRRDWRETLDRTETLFRTEVMQRV